ncbi:ISKra4 family transposase [Nostocaceae cyanobacterium CENA369]|uniref:ISKra4 family transposase n=5 Tax=Dendronalium phyllosphericum CENA369 TaxID=1725256 RepID=A0A8J7I948_9NOST|nr:ISKra4 family transposase [Dendronalium phyllosphericum]MBH8578371.1 ISKra4 family transposase [Dendronalium phyllosphericum CENA369]
MQYQIEQLFPSDNDWQHLCKKLQASITLTALVLTAWQMGLWFARAIVEQQLTQRAQSPTFWENCPRCSKRLRSKGFIKRQMLTLVGQVEWQRRVGRCPNRCAGSQSIPFDNILNIHPYQQISSELTRLGCLLAVFLPFGLAAWMLQQLCGIAVDEDTLWKWVQAAGRRAIDQLKIQLQHLENGQLPCLEFLDATLVDTPLIIAADGVTVPFRSQSQTPKGKIVWREVKIALVARLGKYKKQSGEMVTRLHQRRLVAVLGDIDDLQPRLRLEAFKQGMTTAETVVWISDGARGFWRLFEQSFARCAIGILDFYHAAQHLWKAASAYSDGNPARTPQMWFKRMCHQLRHGRGKNIIQELNWLSKSQNTSKATQTILRQVRDYLNTHFKHIQYRTFKKLGLPIGSGMVESACKWLIQQRFKGVGMRWSEDGFNHLLHLRLAWVNQRFDTLFSDEPLTLTLYSPND